MDYFDILMESYIFKHFNFKFGLPDTKKLIQVLKLKPVKTHEIFKPGSDEFHPYGLFSEEIFGKIGTYERSETPAYIDLTKFPPFAQPPFINLVKKHSSKLFDAILTKTKMYYDKSTSTLIEATRDIPDDQTLTGSVLLQFLIENYNKIENLNDFIRKAIDKNKEKILTNYLIVLPADLRPIRITQYGIQIDEINEIYISILKTTNSFVGEYSDINEFFENFGFTLLWSRIQYKLYQLYDLVKNVISKKEGLFRGNILGKRIDFAGRTVATNDPTIKPYEIGVPYRMCVEIGKYFVLHTLITKTSKKYNQPFKKVIARELNYNLEDVEYYMKLYADGIDIDKKFEEILKEAVDQSLKGKYVLVKRDPALHRDSWDPKVLIPVDGFAIRINPAVANQLNLDFDGDSVLSDINIYDKTGKVIYSGSIADLFVE